jgi:hypothetical protein
MSEVAKSAHAATTDKVEHAVITTKICPYRQNMISNDDFEPSEVACMNKIPDENLEGTEDEHLVVGSPLRVDGPELPTPASLRTPDNARIATAKRYYSQ